MLFPPIKIIVSGAFVVSLSPPLALLLKFQVYKALFPVSLILISVRKKVNIDLVGEKTEKASERLIAWNDRTVSIFSSLRGIVCSFPANGKVDYE